MEFLVWLLCTGVVSGAIRELLNSWHAYISPETKQKYHFKRRFFPVCT